MTRPDDLEQRRPPPTAGPPPSDDPEYSDESDWQSPFQRRRGAGGAAYRGAANDPVFGYLIALALSIGLIPLIPLDPALRYVLAWGVMAGFGVLSWLLGTSARIWTETPENLGWGVIFGLIVGVPFLFIGGAALRQTAQLVFLEMSPGEALAFAMFVMPLAETLFFRGVLQESRPFYLVGLLASVWSFCIFLPMLDMQRYPAVALLIGAALVMMNLIYSYVRARNGLAAAWLCQIVLNLLLLFAPLL